MSTVASWEVHSFLDLCLSENKSEVQITRERITGVGSRHELYTVMKMFIHKIQIPIRAGPGDFLSSETIVMFTMGNKEAVN